MIFVKMCRSHQQKWSEKWGFPNDFFGRYRVMRYCKLRRKKEMSSSWKYGKSEHHEKSGHVADDRLIVCL